MNHINTKSIVQGASIAALFGVFSLINTYTAGMLDIFICYCMVIPLVWYGYTYNLKMNILTAIASLLVVLMFGTPFFVISSISALLIGIFLGEAIKKECKGNIIVLGTFIVCLLNNILIYEVFSSLLGMDLGKEVMMMLEGVKDLLPSMVITTTMVESILPSLLLAFSLLEMYIIILLCQLILIRMKIPFPGYSYIVSLHFSKKFSIVFLGIMLLCGYGIYGMNLDYIFLKYIMYLSQFIFVIQGFSFMNLYGVIKRKTSLIPVSFLFIIIPMTHWFMTIIGLVDIYSDLRKHLLYNSND